jgi:hypothetical protein
MLEILHIVTFLQVGDGMRRQEHGRNERKTPVKYVVSILFIHRVVKDTIYGCYY